LENVLSRNCVRAWNGKVRAVGCRVAAALAKILPNELALLKFENSGAGNELPGTKH
jgi:hypothetical protein